MQSKVGRIHRTKKIHLDSLEIGLCLTVRGNIQILRIINSGIRGDYGQFGLSERRNTKINSSELFFNGFKDPNILLPFRDIGFEKHGISFAKFSYKRLPLSRIHVYDGEFPSLLS